MSMRLLGAGDATRRNLDRLENGAVAVVSGQQVGLFGGPAYAFYKALSAIRIAEELSEAGIPAVPVFWMATEDHDLDEVRHVSWFQAGKLTRFELPAERNARTTSWTSEDSAPQLTEWRRPHRNF